MPKSFQDRRFTFGQTQTPVNSGVVAPESGRVVVRFVHTRFTASQSLFGNHTGTPRFELFIGTDNIVKLNFRSNLLLIQSVETLADGVEYEIELIWTVNSMSMQIDNGTIYTATASGALPTNNIYLGGRDANGTINLPLSGKIKSLVIYNAAGAELYNATTHSTLITASQEQIDFFFDAGQSNARGTGPTASTQTPTAGTAFDFNWNTHNYENLDDPRGYGVNAAVNGSWSPKFCKDYYAATGRKVGIVACATGSSEQAEGSNQLPANSWDASGDLTGIAIGKIKKAIEHFTASGFNVSFKGCNWSQGETDGIGINASAITKATYKAALIAMIGRFRAAFGDIHFWISRTGTKTDDSDAGYEDIREAQDEVAAAYDYVHMAFTGAVDFPGESKMSDNFHYTTVAYDEIGAALAVSAAATGNDGVMYMASPSEGLPTVLEFQASELPVLVKLVRTSDAQVRPATGYVAELVAGNLYRAPIVEPLVGLYYWYAIDDAAAVLSDGYITLTDDAATFRTDLASILAQATAAAAQATIAAAQATTAATQGTIAASQSTAAALAASQIPRSANPIAAGAAATVERNKVTATSDRLLETARVV